MLTAAVAVALAAVASGSRRSSRLDAMPLLDGGGEGGNRCGSVLASGAGTSTAALLEKSSSKRGVISPVGRPDGGDRPVSMQDPPQRPPPPPPCWLGVRLTG